ncbi:MAG: hypothetical protein HYS08_09175 [Chlamydiae bacterium]|nr:hypothetical protein [Chlamydiota bacterium]MBI3265534.1 hypothetical protein [Chlamydiota bacterium]
MKRITAFILLLAFNPSFLQAETGASLELYNLSLMDEKGQEVSEGTVQPGAQLTLEMKYGRRGFPTNSLTTLEVELYDPTGEILLQDSVERPFTEGDRLDRYRVNIPANAAGKFLLALTIRVSEGEADTESAAQVLAEVSKTIPFDVEKENAS